MMAASVSSVFADENVELTDFGVNYGIVNVDSLNVREYSNIESPVVETLSKYTYVNIMWLEPGWAAVSLEDGRIGYISIEYIDIYKGEMPEVSIDEGDYYGNYYDNLLRYTWDENPQVELLEFSTGYQEPLGIAKQFLGVPYI